MFFEGSNAVEPLSDACELVVDQAVDVAAVRFRMGLEIEQALDVIQGNVQCAAVPDEGQTLDMSLAIGPVAVTLTGRGGYQPGFFVITHGVDLCAGPSRQFANLHVDLQKNRRMIWP